MANKKQDAFDNLGNNTFPAQRGYKSALEATVKEGFIKIDCSNQIFEKQDRPILVSKSRELYRNSSIYAGLINKVVQYVIDKGLNLQCMTSNVELNKEIENKWYEYFKYPEITGTYTGTSFTQAILREYLICGEAFILLLENGKMQLIESEQITSLDNKVGIDIDDFGKAITYYITPYDTSGKLDYEKTTAYGYQSIIHLRKLDRPSALRGLPLLQSAFSVVTKIGEVINNEVSAMEVLSQFAIAITKEKPMGPKSTVDTPTRITQVNKATIVHCNAGEGVQGISRNIPAPNFKEAINVFMNHLATPLGLCSEIVSNDWTSSNFSQSRVAINSSYNSFRIIQDVIVTNVLDVIYQWILTTWITNTELKKLPKRMSIDEIYYHQFQGPQYPSIDALKDGQAQIQSLSNGINTYSNVLNDNARDYQDVINQRKNEILNAITISKEIEANTGVCVPYQIFAGLSIPVNAPPVEYTDTIDEGNTDNRLNIGE